MKKNVYKLDNIDCMACSSKIEDGINKLEGVFSCSLNYMFLKFFVTFDESLITDEEIEKCIHKSLKGVKIVQKNSEDFMDTYQEASKFKKMVFRTKKY